MKNVILTCKSLKILRYLNLNRERDSYQFTKVSQALVANVVCIDCWGMEGLPCGSLAVGNTINETTVNSFIMLKIDGEAIYKSVITRFRENSYSKQQTIIRKKYMAQKFPMCFFFHLFSQMTHRWLYFCQNSLITSAPSKYEFELLGVFNFHFSALK